MLTLQKRIALVLVSSGVAVSLTAIPALAQQKLSSAGPKVVVTLWSWSPVSSTMANMIAAIEKKHPNITIKATVEPHTAYFTSLKAAAASGSLPDLIGLSPGSVTQQYRPYLQPLNGIAGKLWGSRWAQNFAPALMYQARLGNPPKDWNYYMLPEESEVINVWYNRSIFAKLHLSPPKNLNQMIADAHKISAAGYMPFYQGANTGLFDTWVFMQIAAQTDLQGLLQADVGRPTWTQPGMIKAAEVWKTLFTQNVFQPGALGELQYPTGANLFAAGRVGMMSLGSWWLQETTLPGSLPPGIANMSGFGKFFFPAVTPGGNPTPPLGGIDIGWGITKTASKSAAVQRASEIVLKDLISGPGEQVALNSFNDLPAFKGMHPTVKMTPHMANLFSTYLQELQSAKNHQMGNPVVQQTLDSNLQAIGAGTVTPTKAMSNVQQAALSQLKK